MGRTKRLAQNSNRALPVRAKNHLVQGMNVEAVAVGPMSTRRFVVLTVDFLYVTTSESNSFEHIPRRNVEVPCMVLPFLWSIVVYISSDPADEILLGSTF